MKFFLQSGRGQVKRLLPSWSFLCLAKDDELENIFSHDEQEKGFSFECVMICSLRFPDLAKLLLQISQVNFRSPWS